MPGNIRDSRGRTARLRRGEQEKGDVVAFALAAQVVLCALLLIAAPVAKKADEARYGAFKARYQEMVTDPAEGEKALALLMGSGDGLRQFFTAAEQAVESLLERFAGRTDADGASEAEAESNLAADEEPPAGAENGAEPIPPEDPEESASSELGQGGLFPVDLTGLNADALPAPTGCTLAPVALAGKVKPPVTGLITSEFAYRDHPVSGESDFHTGMDIAAEEGRDILAALSGVVLETGESEIYGNYITIWHSAALQTFYAHCSEIIARQGARVRQGERIAKVGQTGVVTGPHLHFSVIVEGLYADPYWVLRDNIELVE